MRTSLVMKRQRNSPQEQTSSETEEECSARHRLRTDSSPATHGSLELHLSDGSSQSSPGSQDTYYPTPAPPPRQANPSTPVTPAADLRRRLALYEFADFTLLEEMLANIQQAELEQQKFYGRYLVDPQIRSTVIEWVLDLMKSFRLSAITVSLAVLIFDLALSSETIPTSRLQALTASCVLLAGIVKFYLLQLSDC